MGGPHGVTEKKRGREPGRRDTATQTATPGKPKQQATSNGRFGITSYVVLVRSDTSMYAQLKPAVCQ